MRIVDNKALLLKVRSPNIIIAAIPKSKAMGDNQVLVNWGMDETRVLKNLNIKNVPSPIIGQYGWKGQYAPFKHQKLTSALHAESIIDNGQITSTLCITP